MRSQRTRHQQWGLTSLGFLLRNGHRYVQRPRAASFCSSKRATVRKSAMCERVLRVFEGTDRCARAQLGREAKRLLDHGRVLWLRERSKLNAKLVTFCDASVSPENCLLLAS